MVGQRAVRATTDNPYLFQTVKDGVDIVAAAEHYGLKPDRRGWCSCPFHGEKTPSFHLRDQRGHCFGCGWSGDVLDLVSGMLHVGPLEAVKELNSAFCLGIDLDAPVDTEAVARAAAARRERERFKQWREETIRVLTACFYNLWQSILRSEGTPETGVSAAHAEALRYIGTVEYYLDVACFGKEDEIKENRKTLEKMKQKVKEANMNEKR